MAEHPNFLTTQKGWDALAGGDPGPAFDGLADAVIVENGPGAGPWRVVEGKDALAVMMLEFMQQFDDDWLQRGRCLYADDRMSITLVHETGTAHSGDRFDNQAIWIGRFDSAGQVERIWTVDLDAEACEEFWRRNPVPQT